MMNRRLHLASGRGCFVVLVMMHHSLELVKKSRDICAFVIEILQIFRGEMTWCPCVVS